MSIAVECARPGRPRFYVWSSVALAVAVVWGFGPTYFFRAFVTTRDLNLLIHVHALVFSGWVALLVVQTLLVAKQRTDLHRRLGVLGALWACAVIVSGTAVQFRSLSPTSRVEWEAMEGLWQSFAWLAADNTGSFMIFGGLIAAGVLLRRRPQAHKRLMLLATFALMNAPLARIYDEFGWPIDVGPFGFFATNSVINEFMMQVAPLGFLNLVVLPFFAALVVYDLVLHRRIHSATLGGGLVLFLFQPLFVQLLALATPGVAGS